MIDSSILFLDSGIGGLPYLDWLKTARPDWPLSYLADTKYFPYGELDETEVKRAVVETAGRAFASGTPRLVVLACNTASVSALNELRAIAPCPVVGTVPAVKPAAEIKSSSPIGVLATERTINSPYLENLLEAFAPHREVRKVAAGDIVRFVEHHWLDEGGKGARAVMRPALAWLRAQGVGSIVLGCTHFLHVTDVIAREMGSDVRLVDSRDGVGRRILSLLESGDHAFEPDGAAGGNVPGSFYISESGPSIGRYQEFAERHGLDWAGVL